MKQLLFILILCSFAYSSPVLAYNVGQAKEDLNLGRYSSAIESLRELLAKEATNYEAWFLFGVAHVHEQQYHQAIEAFRQVISLRPKLAEPHNNLAAVYNNLGDTKSAVHELEIALEKRPNYTIAEENLADLYIKLALQHYRNTLQHSPNPLVEQRYARLIQVRNPIPTQTEATSAPSIQGISKTINKQKPAIETPKPVIKAKKEASVTVPSSPKPARAFHPPEHSITSVLDALEAWRAAWSSQNLKAYFSAYADDYKPNTRFDSITNWQAYKTRVITNKKFIRVEFEQVEVDMKPKQNSATVMLLQRFQSNTYQGQDFKKISFKYTPQGWKITTEASIK